MALVVEKTTGGREYKVKDLSQADFGRLEIERAEVEMSGLMACRAEFGPSQPFKGARITGSLHMTIQTAVLIETLTALGAKVRSCSCNIFSTQDHAAAAIVRDSASVFAWKGETRQEYWWCTERALDWGPGGGPDLIVDDIGDAALLIHEGVKAEEVYAKTGQSPDPSSTDNAEFQIVLTIIRDGLKTDPMRYHKMKDRLVGVTVETTAGIDRLNQLQANGTLLFPAINHCFAKSTISESTDFLYALFKGIKEATNGMIRVKQAVVCGYEHAGVVYAVALKQADAKVVVFEVDPNLAIQAALRGFSVVKTLDDVVSKADVLVISGSNMDNIAAVKLHLKKMKNDAIIYDVDSILLDHDNNTYAGHKRCFSDRKQIFKVHSHADKWVFPDTNSSILVLRKKEYPGFMLSRPFTGPVVAMLELSSKSGTGKYERKVYGMPEHLEKKVSALHLAQLTAAEETTAQDGQYSLPIDDQGDVLAKTAELKMSRTKRMLLMTVQACSLLGIIALGLSKASKIKVELSLCAIWGN